MIVTLIRHAQVEDKYIGCYNGHIDIGLSKKGYADAKKLSKYFSNSSFDAIFCSDLIRSKETLKQFITREDVIYTNKLREKSWGKHEGKTFHEIEKEIKYINFKQWLNALDGERVEEFSIKIKHFFFNYLPSLKKENILIMTHSGVIKILISHIKDIKLEVAFSNSIGYTSYIVYNSKTKELDFYD